jgi:hypothetical protein
MGDPITINHVRSWFVKHLPLAVICLALLATGGQADAQSARVTGLNDLAFGSVTNLEVDAMRSDSLCAFSSSASAGYSVRASGSGAGGAFTLASGTRTLAYEVQWSSATGQSTGTALSSGVTQGGFKTAARNQQCSNNPTSTASLIVILRAAALSSATAGAYSGTLTIILAPQ